MLASRNVCTTGLADLRLDSSDLATSNSLETLAQVRLYHPSEAIPGQKFVTLYDTFGPVFVRGPFESAAPQNSLWTFQPSQSRQQCYFDFEIPSQDPSLSELQLGQKDLQTVFESYTSCLKHNQIVIDEM